MEKLYKPTNCEEIYLIAGATSKVGRYVVKFLLLKNKKVRVLVRNQEKLSTVFEKEEINKFDKIVVCNLIDDKDYKEKLDECFKVHENQKITYVISALNYTFDKNQNNEEEILMPYKKLIDSCVQHTIKKFLLLSSSHVTRPFSILSLTCNINKRYVQHYKNLVEDYLRKSSLYYLILRPVELVNTEETSAFTLNQGDKLEGKINIATVGRLCVDTISDPWIPNNTALECVSSSEQFKQPYEYKQGNYHFKPETEKDKKVFNHKAASRIVMSVLYSTALFSLYLAYKNAKNLKIWYRIMNILGRMLAMGSNGSNSNVLK
jgi:hypothetical protein